MNGKIITAIVFRVCAIYVLVGAIFALPAAWAVGDSALKSYSNGSYFIPSLIASITLIVGILAFKVLWNLGTKVIDLMAETPAEAFGEWRQLETQLIQLLGLYLLITYGVDLPKMFFLLYRQSLTSSGIGIGTVTEIFKYVVPPLVGCLLIVKAENWKFLLRKLRTAGLK